MYMRRWFCGSAWSLQNQRVKFPRLFTRWNPVLNI
jgi:hypothetical protein